MARQLQPVTAVLLLSLVVILVANLALWPGDDLAIVYALPALVAALRTPPRMVVLLGATGLILDALATAVDRKPVPTWPLTLPGLVAVCAFAVYLARQRELITSYRQSEEERRGQIQRFLAMVAHDIRAPLAVLRAQVELLQSGPTTPTARRKALGGILGAAERLERFSTDLLDAARIGARRFAVEPRPMDLVEVVRQVADEWQARTSQHRLVLRTTANADGVWDRERIVQVVTNLVGNAIHYSEGGEVRITVQRTDDAVVLAVTDEGFGITPEQRAHLFDPFTQPGDRPGRTGVGLGLYITKGIVEAHHGRIWVESQPGKGSTFCVVLPRSDHSPADHHSPRLSLDHANRSPEDADASSSG